MDLEAAFSGGLFVLCYRQLLSIVMPFTYEELDNSAICTPLSVGLPWLVSSMKASAD